MARKVQTVTITDKGRDSGKTFQITEMSAAQAEKWAMRAFLALAKSGFEVPDVSEMGLGALLYAGIDALKNLPWAEAEPLVDEMWGCVFIIPDASKSNVVRPLIGDDIEEVKTRIYLRGEILKLHIDFFPKGAPSKPAKAASA